ncbi:MAG: ISH3 family transposase [Candidatus Omnitrophota bacterium]
MVKIQPASHRKEKVLRAEECCEIAVDAVARHITLPINGSLKPRTIIQSLVGMSTNNLSIHSITHIVERIPCETSVRYHLSKLDLESLQTVQSKILSYSQNTILKPGKSYHFAVDFTNDPYYGTIVESNHDYVIKSRQKESTTTFYSYISLSIITTGHRLTLAVFPVKCGVQKTEYLKRFLAIIRDLDLHITILCLDRGFYSHDVFAFLQTENVPHIVPVRNYGKVLGRVLTGNRARYAQYIMQGTGNPIGLNLAIDVHYLKGKNSKAGNVNLGYVVHGISWNPRRVYNVYKKRFAIESSYRMRNIVKAKTSSKSVTFRYLLTIISFLLKNVWVALQRVYFSLPQRGPISVNEDLFRFDLFRILIWDVIRNTLKIVALFPGRHRLP